MNVEISRQTAEKIAAVIGTSDEATIGRILDRVADDEQFLRSLLLDPPSQDDIDAVRDGIADLQAGRVRPLDEFDSEFRKRNGFAPRT